MSQAIGVNISEKQERITTYLWLMFFVCFLGNVLAGMASTLMSVYLPVVVTEFTGKTDEASLSEISAYINVLYFVGWAVGGFVWGYVGDKIGRARSLALAVSMYGLFTFLMGLAPSWEMIMLFQFFCGFGVGGVLVVNTTLLSEVWPVKTRSIFIGILNVGFPIGIFSSGAVNMLASGWRQGFMVGIVPLALGIFSFWIFQESELWKATRHDNEKTKQSLAEHKVDLFYGSVIFGSMLIGLWAIFSWMPTWVHSLLTSSDGQQERGLSMMLLGAGGLGGCFVSGWITNKFGIHRTMQICFAACFILSAALFKFTSAFSLLTLVGIGMLSFSFGISQGALGVYIPLLFPVAIRATATGFCFNIGRFFTAAAVFFVGYLVTTLGGYGNSLFTFSFVFVIGYLFIIFSNRSKSN